MDNPGRVGTFPQVAGVILAAGGSTRFGKPKALLDWFGDPFISVIAKSALDGGLDPVVVVAGDEVDSIRKVLAGLQILVVHNSRWPEGMSTSLHSGLLALPDTAQAAMFLLVDQPQITTGIIHSLILAYSNSRPSYVAPMINGRQGNPVLFDRSTFPALLKIEGDKGGRAVFKQFTPSFVKWDDERLFLDVDTPEDYQKLLSLYQA